MISPLGCFKIQRKCYIRAGPNYNTRYHFYRLAILGVPSSIFHDSGFGVWLFFFQCDRATWATCNSRKYVAVREFGQTTKP